MAKATKKVAPKKAPAKKAKAKTEAAPAAAEEQAAPVAAPSTASIVVEDGVPIPATVRSGGVSPYPFASMQPGQSFLIQSEVDADLYTSDEEYGKALTDDFRTIANRLSGAVRRFTKKHEGYKFRVRTVPNEGGVRVWRVED